MDISNVLEDVMKAVKRRGAEGEVIVRNDESLTVSQRLLKPEETLHNNNMKVGVRVILDGKRSSCISSNGMLENIDDLVDRAVAIASSSPEDPFLAISSEDSKCIGVEDELMVFDPTVPDLQEISKILYEVENSALSADSKIVNSEGVSFSRSTSEVVLATSRGFFGSYKKSFFSTSVSIVASENNKMEVDYSFSAKSHFKDLENPKVLGEDAASRATRKLNSRGMKTCKVSVLFENRIATSILNCFSSAINGSAIADKSSFLAERMGSRLFPEDICITDDPLKVGGLSSRPFDGEGVKSRRNHVVMNGMLQNWILDMRTAKQLSSSTTANAIRRDNGSISPGVSNLYLHASDVSPEELMSDIKNGLYVTDVFGFGVNLTTGDYSQGVVGLVIEDGKLSYPVSGITIAGNLLDMFSEMRVADDLVFRGSISSPTLRFRDMVVSGIN